MTQPPAVCYFLSNYRSHRRAGLDYQNALTSAGIQLVDDPADAAIVILHDEPWSYPGFFRAWPVLRQRHVIAYAVWEPDMLSADPLRWLGLVDEIWTSSTYCRDILQAAGRPVAVVPHIVTPPQPDAGARRALRERIGLAEGRFVFYTIAKIEERKNIEAGIRAYAAAFPDGGPAYVVRTTSPLPVELAATPGIVAWSEDATDAEIAALHDIGDCLVSPHCAEGWGLCISDAMAHGNLVVATGFSGNMDYTTAENSVPVGFVVDTIRRPDTLARFGLADASPRWAYVDEDDLRQRLRAAHDDRDGFAGHRANARSAMAAFGSDVVARRMLLLLNSQGADF